MKKIFVLVSIFTIACINTYAQQNEAELIRSAFRLDKKAKVAAFMQLPDSSAAKFWPIYNKYEAERTAIGDRRIKMLEKYASVYDKLDPVTAEKLWKESAAIQKAEVALRERYASLVKKSVSAIAGFNFFMVEDYIATAVKNELYTAIPTTPL